MHFEQYTGLLVFSGALMLMLLTVPWPAIKKWLPFGLVSGLGIAFLLILIMQNWLHLWIFRHVDFIYLGTIPLILSAAWTPTEIFFAHFLSRYQGPALRLLLILAIPAVAVAVHFFQIQNHVLTYQHWNYFGTYLVSSGIHFGLAYYLHRVDRIPLFNQPKD